VALMYKINRMVTGGSQGTTAPVRITAEEA
jgi:hypothetical protein